jgi:uncharacterized beta-barrel protein YwiB (DUF1934 family)
MNKEVLVAISGLQFSEGMEPDRIETINSGEYYKKGNSHYILFDEVTEGDERTTRNMIKFSDGICSVNKKGVINVNMLFEEKKRNLTNYATPFGNVMIGIDTQNIDLAETEERIDLLVDYALEANYEHLANCKLKIAICNRADGMQLSI